ncbi:hypothetical protein [Nonlabens ulvanivorans]|uniref:Uncharacterized protein n=1 Tax=Nonlabens ulvanivorans TaxID=906888 RepID=A0A084JXH3_NONUL|nr:hypothetical protein [Nonlabens ulvanivorans]KEZ93657.1 hypothetical protein IL45_05495 [Nonlabens ulvanivorans]PRX14248.1 hypothetical protein LY02_01278 [Nonlabens ulvanivorans]
MKKIILITSIIIIAYLVYGFITGYTNVNQSKYGIEYNSERKKLGLTEIPETFDLTVKPINTFFDYFNASGIYSIEFTTNQDLSSGLIKKRVDVDENGIGIIREYSFYKKGNDTVVDIHDYYQ